MSGKYLEYISLSEFANKEGLKEDTIKRNYKKIPGVSKTKTGYSVLSGTRYPYNFRGIKLKDSADRRFVLLKAISSFKYISHKELQVEEKQFISFLREFVSAGLIKENGLSNHYGANYYDCTALGDELLKENKNRAKRELLCLIAEMAGKYTGAILSVKQD